MIFEICEGVRVLGRFEDSAALRIGLPVALNVEADNRDNRIPVFRSRFYHEFFCTFFSHIGISGTAHRMDGTLHGKVRECERRDLKRCDALPY